MLFPLPLRISNYRSIGDDLEIPFQKKITFLLGQNNSGKSNILRVLSIFFNKAYNRIDEEEDFDSNTKVVRISTVLGPEFLKKALKTYPNARNSYAASGHELLELEIEMSRNGLSYPNSNKENLEKSIKKYFNYGDAFIRDFSQSGGNNHGIFLQNLKFEELLPGTAYLPNIRFITEIDKEPPQFINWKAPGETIAFGSVIRRLSEMDRPDPAKRFLREHKKAICEFMAFCLEKKRVSIEVPDSKSTILVDIDGDERSIDAFGTGVEQLLMIGLASMGFPKKIVLIDEPEIYLHPRAQKRIVTYLNQNVDAQFVIATHSAAVLDTVESDIIQVVNGDKGRSITRTLKNNYDRYRAVRDIGHSPSELLQTKYAIWVEGPSDRIYLKSWISRIDSKLIEGIDYSIIFYGGRVLSQHSFEDAESDLVKAVSLSRSFAVVIDSDRRPDKPNINATKSRVREEIQREGGYVWITEGREIENYVPASVVKTIASEMEGVTVQTDKRGQVLDPHKVNKVEFARRVVAVPTDEWPLDLKKMVDGLVEKILAAR